MRSNAAVKSTKQKGIFTFQNLVNSLHWIYSIFVPQFLLNSFYSLDTCFAYHALIRSKMILIISLHTVDPMLSPLWLPYSMVIRLWPFSLPESFKSRITPNDRNIEVWITWITWSISGCSHFFQPLRVNAINIFPWC